ncbi:MAG: hypothetical protein ABI718_04865 [Acidobacteriota bacterium]
MLKSDKIVGPHAMRPAFFKNGALSQRIDSREARKWYRPHAVRPYKHLQGMLDAEMEGLQGAAA